MPTGLSIGIFIATAAQVLAADATPWTVIGLVRASGEFTIDGSWTRDNSTVFHGSEITTIYAPSHVILVDGTRVDIGLNSRSRIYRDRVAVEQGVAQVKSSRPYAVIAGKIRIDSPQRTLVHVIDSRTVAVTPFDGVAEVKNTKGMLIALVPPGRTLEFSEADPSFDEASVRGCLQKVESKSGEQTTRHYTLRDQTTNVVVELVGPDLEKHIGKTVDASGLIDSGLSAVPGALYVIRTSTMTDVSGQECPSIVGEASRSAPPTPGASKVAIIGGIAAAGGSAAGTAAALLTGGARLATTPAPAIR
jgi:hypothetical protein